METLLPMSVTLTGLPGSPSSINLHDRTRFELVEWSEPGISYRLTEIAGEYQPGSVLVNAVRDTASLSFVVRALGSSEGVLRANILLLFRALGRFSYSMTEVIDGNTHTYVRCRPANISPIAGRDWDVLRGMHRQEFSVQVRCHPRTVPA